MSPPLVVQFTIELTLENGTQMLDAVELAEYSVAKLIQAKEVGDAQLVAIERVERSGSKP